MTFFRHSLHAGLALEKRSSIGFVFLVSVLVNFRHLLTCFIKEQKTNHGQAFSICLNILHRECLHLATKDNILLLAG